MSQRILLTGGAGFIGSTLAEKLLEAGHQLTVIDNFDSFYDRSIKEQNIASFRAHPNLQFIEASITDPILWENRLADATFDTIVHLAAKAGVRPSIQDPLDYQDVNVKGTQLVLEFARTKKIIQFVFASSSSVYGTNENYPWAENDHVLQPISPYASTKVSGELLGNVYSHLFGIRFIALRFFTVYGPRQRPDLAIHKFADAIVHDKKVVMFGTGDTRRDYTYVDDIVNGIMAAIAYNKTMYEVINLGNHDTVSLSEMIATIEEVFGKKANLVQEPEQPGDVRVTYAAVEKAGNLLGYRPSTSFKEGVQLFKNWYYSRQQ